MSLSASSLLISKIANVFVQGFFWKEFFGRNYFVEINKELIFLSRFWGNFVSIKEGRMEEEFSILISATQAHRT